MRQFVFANAFVAEKDIATAKAGNVYIQTGESGCDNIVLVRDVANGGNILYPIFKKDFTLVTSDAPNVTGAKFKATYTITEVDPNLDYTIVITKKGTCFNERANWTETVRTTSADTATTVAAKLVKLINGTSVGLIADNNLGVITLEATEAGVDYKVQGADELLGTDATVTVAAKAPWMDAAMIKDLFAKCAADAGFEYTYDELEGIYPAYNFNPLASADATDVGFIVYTMRFTEPRLVGTREEAVYQILQVAFPKGKETGFADAIGAYVE